MVDRDKMLYTDKRGFKDEILPEEQFYNELLEVFVKDLNSKGITVMMIAVNNQLEHFPMIEAKVSELSSKGLIDYIEVMSWLKEVSNYGTPEGHLWGKKAHGIIGTKIAETIKLAHL